MKKILFVLFVLSGFAAKAQTIRASPTYTGTKGLVAVVDSSNGKLYKYPFSLLGSGGGGGSIDTSSLSNRINAITSAAKTGFVFVDSVSGNDATGLLGIQGKPFRTIQAAITAGAAVSDLFVSIGLGAYAKPTTTRGNIHLIGAGRPTPNWTQTQSNYSTVIHTAATALTGGTIIKGGLDFLDFENVEIGNLGIDNGFDYVTAGGTEKNALGFGKAVSNEAANTPAPSYNLLRGIKLWNVALLCKNASSLYHGLVMEDIINPSVTDIIEIYGTHGFAFKTTGGVFNNLWAYSNATDNLIVKANNYSVASGNIINNFHGDSSATGLIFENKSAAQMRDNTVNDIFLLRSATGVTTVDDFGNGFAGIQVNNANIRGATTAFANNTNYGYSGYVDGTYAQNLISGTDPLASYTLYDDFTRADNSSTVGSLQKPVVAWTVQSGTWGISSNRAYCVTETATGSQVFERIIADAGKSDFTYTANIRLLNSTGTAGGLNFRYTDASNHWLVEVANGQISMYKVVAGAYTNIGGVQTLTNTANTDIEIKVVTSGNNITVYKNGTSIITGSDAALNTATKVGLFVESGSIVGLGVRISDMKLQ